MTKRLRHVFPNREIPHLWAHQTQDEARNGTGSLYFRGATIYSYGSHFPIASHVTGSQGQPGILFTSERNSVTTSQHMSAVSRSIPPDIPVFTVPHLMLGFSDHEDAYQHEKNFTHYTREVAEHLSTCARARSSYNKEYHHERAVELRKEALCYATFFACQIQPSIQFLIWIQKRWLPSSLVRLKLQPRKPPRLNVKQKKNVFVGPSCRAMETR